MVLGSHPYIQIDDIAPVPVKYCFHLRGHEFSRCNYNLVELLKQTNESTVVSTSYFFKFHAFRILGVYQRPQISSLMQCHTE